MRTDKSETLRMTIPVFFAGEQDHIVLAAFFHADLEQRLAGRASKLAQAGCTR